MPNFIDRTGQRFGRLTVLTRAENKRHLTAWVCECDCGNRKVIQSGHLQQGRIVSCGCWKDENAKERETVHGLWGTKLHGVWLQMRQRCNNHRNKSFPDYGGRGITACPEWDEFLAFKSWADANGYAEGLTIERVNVNGGYNPDNCTWIPKAEQGKNTRRTLNNRRNADG